MRKKLIVANWKMNLNTQQASMLVHRLQERIQKHNDVDVVLAPSFLHIQPLSLQIDRRKFKLAAQNCYFEDQGAYTGQVSATQLKDLVHYVIVGHSEPRHTFGETDAMVAKKVAAVVRNEMVPILCVGETAEERASGHTNQVIHDQVTSGVRNLTSLEVRKIVIAYEPVWAISSGADFKNHPVATAKEAAAAAKVVRHNIEQLYGSKAAEMIRVLYGASTNIHNARGFLESEGIDGLLVGGASLQYNEFATIVAKAHAHASQEGAA